MWRWTRRVLIGLAGLLVLNGLAVHPDLEFIAHNNQIEEVHAFLESLPGALADG